MTLYDNLNALGLIGFMDDTGITSENYKEILEMRIRTEEEKKEALKEAGCLETDVASDYVFETEGEWKAYHMGVSECLKEKKTWKHFNENSWKRPNECAQDDKNYLVSWLESDGKYSSWHRAYYLESERHFFSLENNNSHPLHVDLYFEVPEIDVE